jgi:hypothetical protein
MKYLNVFPYREESAELWDKFLAQVPIATFLHTRRYLSYHADRFRDVSLIIENDKNQIVGLFLAAVDPTNTHQVVSHPGITYGGILHKGDLAGEKMLHAFEAVHEYYREQGFEILQYKAVPYIYHQIPAADDLYALFRLGAVRYRCDLSCAIDLANQPKPSQRRKRSFKKALKYGIEVKQGVDFIKDLWLVLQENLQRKYKVHPVHSISEILHLHSLFPNNIELVVAVLNSKVVAGVVLFINSFVIHAQYIASSEIGYEVCALDAIFDHCIGNAKDRKARYFSFGVSTENEGKYLNTNLYQFKTEFGAGGVIHEFYEINLRP